MIWKVYVGKMSVLGLDASNGELSVQAFHGAANA